MKTNLNNPIKGFNDNKDQGTLIRTDILLNKQLTPQSRALFGVLAALAIDGRVIKTQKELADYLGYKNRQALIPYMEELFNKKLVIKELLNPDVKVDHRFAYILNTDTSF